jgi:hypothetical protein
VEPVRAVDRVWVDRRRVHPRLLALRGLGHRGNSRSMGG